MKRLIYLISPNKIDSKFYNNLDKVLSFKNVNFFQLRLKKIKDNSLIKIAQKIKKITKKHKVKFIINDSHNLVSKINADGCHIGQLDGPMNKVRKKLKNKILGITCHNSKSLAKNAIKNKADYVAFGSFFKSSTKKTTYKANLAILRWAKKKISMPTVAIGGINSSNYKKILSNGADFIACSSYVWNNKKLDPVSAINKFE